MAEKKRPGGQESDKSAEARNLAQEALEEMKHGDRAEGKFLAEEAEQLDPSAADQVLKGKKSGSSAFAGKSESRKTGSAERVVASGDHVDMARGETTTDHDFIRRWAEKRGGRPTVVKGTEDREGEGILRFDFAEPDEKLEEIDWDTFFRTFEDRKLALLYQDKTEGGKISRFFKFVRREGS
jgi:hypothetical protein